MCAHHRHVYKTCTELVTTTDIMVVQSLTRMFDAHLDEYLPQVDGEPKKNPPDGKKRNHA